jgi:hypothetical protein
VLSSTASTVTATIGNDDKIPEISINSVSMNEGTPPAGGSLQTPMSFNVALTNPSSLKVSFSAKTVKQTACAAGVGCPSPDYVALAATVFTIAPGAITGTIKVMIIGDADKEPDETFTVPLSNPVNATISSSHGIGTGGILNDD